MLSLTRSDIFLLRQGLAQICNHGTEDGDNTVSFADLDRLDRKLRDELMDLNRCSLRASLGRQPIHATANSSLYKFPGKLV